MAPPLDLAQHARDGANQVMAIMGAMEENITELQRQTETLGNDLQAAHQETSTAQEEAQSMRAELMSARQEIQRLNSQLASEEASNNSLRGKLRDLGNEFASFQSSFRRGTEIISEAYHRVQRLFLVNNDTEANVSEAEATQTIPSAGPAETPTTTASAPASPAPASSASSASSSPPSEAPTPSSSAESTPATPDMDSVGSILPTDARPTDLAPTPRAVAKVDCYAMYALESEHSGVPLATQSTAHSSVVKMSAHKFGTKGWGTSDSIERNLRSLGYRHREGNDFSRMLVECVHSGTSGVIYEPPANPEQSYGVAIAATYVAMQIGESHEYMEFLADQNRKGIFCPAAVIVTSSGELVSRMYDTIVGLINGKGSQASVINSIKVVQRKGQDGMGLNGLRNNLPTILVSTPGRLIEFIGKFGFSARLLHSLVVCQGPSLASADFIRKMQKIVAWARCVRPSLTGERPIFTSSPCPLTTIVLSRSFEEDPALHEELEQRYLADFICNTNVTRRGLGKHPLLAFEGKIKVQVCAFKGDDRSRHFVEKILPRHRGESILCMDFSRTRVAEFATQCKKLGVPCEVFTKDCDTTTDRNDSKTMQRFRAGQCKIMFTTPAGFEGICYPKVKTAVIFSSPYECFYTDDGGPKPEVYKRRPDALREAIESIGRAGEEATIYILVSSSTRQPVKDDIAKILRQAGYEIPSVLRTSIRY